MALAERATTSNINRPEPAKVSPSKATDKKKTSEPAPYEEVLCETEEATFQNEINPIKLADIDWTNDYKLSKLVALQV